MDSDNESDNEVVFEMDSELRIDKSFVAELARENQCGFVVHNSTAADDGTQHSDTSEHTEHNEEEKRMSLDETDSGDEYLTDGSSDETSNIASDGSSNHAHNIVNHTQMNTIPHFRHRIDNNTSDPLILNEVTNINVVYSLLSNWEIVCERIQHYNPNKQYHFDYMKQQLLNILKT
eukprot:729802_1